MLGAAVPEVRKKVMDVWRTQTAFEKAIGDAADELDPDDITVLERSMAALFRVIRERIASRNGQR